MYDVIYGQSYSRHICHDTDLKRPIRFWPWHNVILILGKSNEIGLVLNIYHHISQLMLQILMQTSSHSTTNRFYHLCKNHVKQRVYRWELQKCNQGLKTHARLRRWGFLSFLWDIHILEFAINKAKSWNLANDHHILLDIKLFTNMSHFSNIPPWSNCSRRWVEKAEYATAASEYHHRGWYSI